MNPPSAGVAAAGAGVGPRRGTSRGAGALGPPYAPVDPEEPPVSTVALSRPTSGKLIAGVCAGLGRRFGLSANVVRILFVASCILPGPQFLVYVALWIVVPKDTGR